MVKNKMLGIRVSEEEMNEIERTRKNLKFNTLSEFILFLWQKFKSERNLTKEKK